jgi:hypothetical protein
MVEMSYRYDILAEDGVYEGWAHSKAEMREKFLATWPLYKDCEVFFSGGAPKFLTLSEYRELESIYEGSQTGFSLFWQKADRGFAKIYALFPELELAPSAREESAENWATIMHSGQTYQDQPYVEHPRRVVQKLRQIGITDEDYFIVAWLHDIVEDTAATLEEVKERFGDRVAAAVDAITRRKNGDWKEPEHEYLMRVMHDPIAVEVKYMDMTDNNQFTRSPKCPVNKRPLYKKYLLAMQILSEGLE